LSNRERQNVGDLQRGKGVFVIERRRQPRVYVELPLDYSRIVDSENFGGMVANATEEGILVYLPERLKIGDLFRIRIFVPGESELGSIHAIAKVVWADAATRRSARRYRYGLHLQSFLKGDFQKFKKLLKGIVKDNDPS
jgi:hypothetical protein